MECNKEEALRAMKLAENKMKENDFVGGQKFGQKAQKLYPEIENISRLLIVCDVHCVSMAKIGGSEMDWYRILQIEVADDVATIKKQYRKLAFLLHPDKNMFPGAEAAFKLVGEANRTLTDDTKRAIYDRKYRDLVMTAARKLPQPQSDGRSFSRTQFGGTANNFQNSGGSSSSHQQENAFWTRCPFCGRSYQYLKVCLGTTLICHSCHKHYVAYDVGTPVMPPESFQAFQNQKEVPNPVPPKGPSRVKKGTSSRKRASNMPAKAAAPQAMSEEGNGAQPNGDLKPEGRENEDVQPKRKGLETTKSATVKSKKPESSKSSNKKRGRKSAVESSDSEGDVTGSSKVNGSHRRSSRQKQSVYYQEKLSDDDDDFVRPPKRSRASKSANSREEEVRQETERDDFSAGPGVTTNGHEKEKSPNKQKSMTNKSDVQGKEVEITDRDDGQKQKSTTDDGSKDEFDEEPGTQTIDCPDPDFSDFDKCKAESCFEDDQIWALYDPEDGMPRFYARIRKVCIPEFKLKIKWLEAKPEKEAEVIWCDKELPVACGNYKLGDSQMADRDMFSHKMHYIKDGRSTYAVYPRKGETWAIFQNWSMNWSSDPEKYKPFKFDFVEIVSDLTERGVYVAYLERVKGFVSLFQRAERNGVAAFSISLGTQYRFSHRVPSFQMTGEERNGVPKGSYELDPAALPSSFFESSDHYDGKTNDGSNDGVDNGFCPGSQRSEAEHAATGEGIPESMKHESKDSKSEFTREGVDVNVKNEKNPGNLTPLKRSAVVSQTDEKMNTPKKHEKTDGGISGTEVVENRGNRTPLKRSVKESQGVNTPTKQENHHEAEPIKLRKSPRDLSKKDSKVIGSRVSNEDVSVRQMQSENGEIKPKSSVRSFSEKPSGAPSCKLSEPGSFGFTQLTSMDKFKRGQVWALRTKGEMYPNTYGHVKRIESTPEFLVHLTLLDPCLQVKVPTQKVCCGAFKVKHKRAKAFPLSCFSHCAIAAPVGEKHIEIYPRKGEIWALNGNRSSSTEYDIVEILEDDGQRTRVTVLSRVGGSQSMFRAPRIQSPKSIAVDVPRAELARFSHQIPAFLHSGGKDDKLDGCWELDPVSTPGGVICLD